MGNAIGSTTVKCFRFVCENLTFPFGNVSLESTIHGLFGDISVSRSKLGFMRNYQKSNDCSTKTQIHTAVLLLPMVR